MTAALAQAVQPATCTLPAAEPATFRPAPTGEVGQPLDDEAREDAIVRAGQLMEKRYADFARTGCLAALGDAHRAMLMQRELVQGRSKAQVLRMEIHKGLI